jgi:small GTP-binding protein
MTDPFEPGMEHKVVLLGDSNVGKTSLIGWKVRSDKPNKPKPTLGCHCCKVECTVDRKTVTLQIWDTAGQEVYRALVPIYVRGARCVLLVFDISDAESFKNLGRWYELLDDALIEYTPIFVVASKIDLAERCVVDDAAAMDFAATHKAKFLKVSALTGKGVNVLFKEVAMELVKLAIHRHQPQTIQESREEGCLC